MTVKLDIKVAEITPSFTRAAKEILEARRFMSHRESEQRILKKYLSEQGFDQMKTRMRRLKYQKYANIVHENRAYLYGLTNEIIVELRGARYNIGSYHIFIPQTEILSKQVGDVHFVPDKDKLVFSRHLHHGASHGNGIDPLSMVPSTCWGNIGPSYQSALSDCDIADIFRVLYLFVIKLNFHSPLRVSWIDAAMRWGTRL